MIIALSKELQIRDANLKIINVNHWVIKDINHRVYQDFAIVIIDGYTNRQSRLDGDSPVVKNVRFKIKNTYGEKGNILTDDYNKFTRYQSDTADAKHKEFIKEAALEFLASTSEFSDATND